VLLIVNVASKCGNTPQYAGLEALYGKYKKTRPDGAWVPCNQFGGQEPGTAAEIKEFCSTKYHVTFPLFEKIEVNGANRHPLYVRLAGKDSPSPAISAGTHQIPCEPRREESQTFRVEGEADAAELTSAVESALAGKR